MFFEVDEGKNQVKILALFNTHQDSVKWPE